MFNILYRIQDKFMTCHDCQEENICVYSSDYGSQLFVGHDSPSSPQHNMTVRFFMKMSFAQ